MNFANLYKTWTSEDWKKVNFSDETKINFLGSDGRQYCWVKPGNSISEKQVQSTLKYGGGSIMIWGCFTSQGVGYERLIQGTMNSHQYIKILEEEYLETLDFYNLQIQNSYFQHDNDPKHTSKMTQKWLSDHQIRVLQWPPQSPDLNPIEHLWSQVKKKLSEYPNLATSSEELWNRFVSEWRSIPVERCLKLIESMPDRIQAVLKAKGGHTKY